MTTHNKTILLVEDEAIIAMAETQMLEKHGYAVITAYSGEEAVETFRKTPGIDLILMDIDLGRGMDGTDAAELILKEKDIPLVFLSSHTEPEVVEKTEGITSYGYVVKNSGETILLASIKMAFRLYEANLQIQEQNRDITEANEELESALEEMEAANEELQRAQMEILEGQESLGMLFNLSMLLNSITDFSRSLDILLETVLKLESIDSGGVYVSETEGGAFNLVTHRGLSGAFVSRVCRLETGSPNLQMVMKGKAIYGDYDDIRRVNDGVREKEGLRAMAVLPVSYQGELIAIMNLASHTHDVIPENVRTVLETLALQIGNALSRIRTEERRRESEERYRTLVESLPVGLFRTTGGNEGKFIMANRALARMHGYDSVDDLLSLNVTGIYADPGERAVFSDELLRMGLVEGRKLKLRRKDGTVFEGAVTARSFTDASGKTACFDGIIVDISDQQRMEEALKALRDSEYFLSESQRIAHLGSWSLDPSDNRLTWSDEVYRIFGFEPGEFTATYDAFLDAVHPEDRAAVDEAYSSSLSEGRDSYDIEHRVIRKRTGEVRHVHEKCVHCRDDSGAVVRSIGMVQDITERKRAGEEIRQQLSEKETLLKEVHHRIKNNITSIEALLSLQSGSVSSPEALSVLKDAMGRVQSMRRIYDSLLLDDGYRDIPVRKYLDELTDAVIELFPERGKVNLEKLIDDFTLDVKRLFNLGAIVNELLTNVMKYAFIGRDSGVIRIVLEKRDNRIRLIIQDDGSGLPEGFDMNKSKGLGLVLVGMLSRQMDGSFVIENKNGVRSSLEFEL